MAGSSTAGKVIPFPGAATAALEELRADRPGANAPASSAGVSPRALATAVAIHVAAMGGLLAWPMSPPVLAPAIVVEVVAMTPPASPREPTSAIEEPQPSPPDPPPVPEPETASVRMPVEPVSEAISEVLPEPEPEPVPVPLPKPLALPRPTTKPPPPRVAPPPPPARNPASTQQAAAPPRSAAVLPAAPAAPSTPARERTGAPSYTAVLLSWLERYRQYPRLARLKRIEGTVILSLTLSRSGSLKAVAVKKGSGQSVLDDAAVDMARRADPFPPLPATFVHDRIEFVVPVVFALER